VTDVPTVVRRGYWGPSPRIDVGPNGRVAVAYLNHNESKDPSHYQLMAAFTDI
jgi:hypothetical protein